MGQNCIKEKPLKVNALRGFLVAGVGEISNFDLVMDFAEVVDYLTCL